MSSKSEECPLPGSEGLVAGVAFLLILFPVRVGGSCPPTITVTIAFTGLKSSGDNLSFGNDSLDCSESLGLQNCPGAWLWNIEGRGVVSDDASKWTVKQSYTGRAKGYYKDSNGNLQSFDHTLNHPDDGPDPAFLQQPSGQTTAYWIDSPGAIKNFQVPPPPTPIDSMTEVENFTTKFCSKTVTNDCSPVEWYDKLVIDPGSQLDTSLSGAGYGSLTTNF